MGTQSSGEQLANSDAQRFPFVDVTPTEDNAFREAILWLAQQGISTGWEVGDGMREFRPVAPIERQAMAAFLYRHVNGAGN